MRPFIQLCLMTLMLGTVMMNNNAIAAELRTGHLLPIAVSVESLRPAQSVGVLLSDYTRDNLDYLERYHDTAMHGAKDVLDARIREAFVNSSDPELAIDWLMHSLQSSFLSVTVYDDLDALVQARPDVVVILDTHNQLLTQRNDQVEARFIARFYDAHLQYLAKAEGAMYKHLPSVWMHGEAAAQIAAQIEQQRDVQVDALKQFDVSLKALLRAG